MKGVIVSVVLMLSIMVMSSQASALGLKYYGIEDTINEDLTVSNMITLKFDSPITHLDYNLDFRIEDFEHEADFELADCVVIESASQSTISCDFIGMTEQRNTLVLKFNTRNVIRKIGDNLRFTVNYGISLPIERSFTIIKLPQNSILAGTVANESYSPSTGGILTDGKRIMVYWEEEGLTSGDSLQFSVLYSIPTLGTLNNFVIAAVTFVVIIVMVGIAVYIRRGSESEEAVQDAVKSVLNRDEKRLVDILQKHEGKAGQKVIVRESDFSKAKVSRVVKGLKSRGIVGTEPISGRENRVILRIDKEKPEEE
jgi:hypothetical protein